MSEEEKNKYKASNIVPPVTQWVRDHTPDDKMLWKNAFGDQITFVRDRIPAALCESGEEYNGIKNLCLNGGKSWTFPCQ
jgi:hypothetical protein